MGAFVSSPARAADLCSAHCFFIKAFFHFRLLHLGLHCFYCGIILLRAAGEKGNDFSADWLVSTRGHPHPLALHLELDDAVCGSQLRWWIPVSLVHRVEPQGPQMLQNLP